MANRGMKSAQPRADDVRGPTASVAATATRSSAPASKPQRPGVGIGPFEIFKCCIERSKNLLKIHEAAHGKKAKPERYLADAHRAAIVLGISALDAFVRSFTLARIRSIVADKTIALPDTLATRIKTMLKDDALLEAARKDDLLDRVEKAFRSDFDKKSFQGTKQITETLMLVGLNDVFHNVAISAEENEDTLRQRLDRFTKRRHVIAHVGDLDLTQNPPREHPATKRDAEDCIKIVTLIAKHINELGDKA
jgi:hypothetical protein